MGMNWQLVWWVLGTLCVPISLPWLAVQIVNRFRRRQNLKGKVVLITGASSGLGEAMAHQFYKYGCRVILAARRQKELERVRDDLLREHTVAPAHQPVVITLDLADAATLPAAVKKAVSIFGQIDILVNNGGVSHRGSVQATKLEVDLQVMQTNYFGQVALTKAVLPYMMERKLGHIVAVSSIQGKIAIPFRSAYAASKHAFQAFCDSMRPEVAPYNIDVTVVSPGYIQTSLSVNALTGSGQTYGVMDETTASGYSAAYVAEQIVSGVILQKKEVIIASAGPQIAILLRTLLPSVYFWIMQKRANKMLAAAKIKTDAENSSQDATVSQSSQTSAPKSLNKNSNHNSIPIGNKKQH